MMQLSHINQPRCIRRESVVPRAFLARLRSSDPDTEDTKTEKIYIGQGRYVEDNPEKYPDKTVLAGGWAGGEKGLQQFVAQSALETATEEAPKQSEPASVKKPEGPDAIYIGQGRFIKDDPRKYPNKESTGGLTGATGGFAGGEMGVKQFVDKASLDLAPPEVARKRLLVKDIAAMSALIAITAASFYGFRVLEGGPEAAQLPTLEGIAAAPGALTSSAQDLIEGSAAVAASAVADPRGLYIIGAITAGAATFAGGRALRAGVDRASASVAKSAGQTALRGAVVLAFLAAAYTLAGDW